MTDENRKKIVEMHFAGVPLREIAERFGITIGRVSAIAIDGGSKPRHLHPRRMITLRLRPDVYEELKIAAKAQFTRPEVVAREAIAAHLGLDR